VTAKQQFVAVVEQLHMDGIYPAPTTLNKILHGHSKSNLGGDQSKWRLEVMARLKINHVRKKSRHLAVVFGKCPIPTCRCSG